MRRHLGFLLFFAVLMLLIPAFAFIGQSPRKAKVPSLPEIPDTVTKEDYEENNFYRIKNHKTGEIMTLSPADYIKGVVAAEIPISYQTEALKAQAVAAHTYALRQIDTELTNPTSDLEGAYLSTDPAHFQAYVSKEEMREMWGNNYDINYKKLSDAVDAVIGEVVTFEDEPIIAAFHAISGGKTESAETVWGKEVSYLKPVDSEGDELSPEYETDIKLKEEEVKKALLGKYPKIKLSDDRTKWFAIQKRTDSGTVTELKAGDQTITGRELREILKLSSSNFSVSYQDGMFTFASLGKGHGVGMSQYGADYLARQGKDYKEILTHYYTGVKITKIENS